jgi:ATP-binding cassette, subfamily C (CFTR/MRP), member 1
VDAHVSDHLIHNCILHPDLLGNKTRVMVTHNMDILPYAQSIIVMQDGNIVQKGSYNELLQVQGIFRKLMKQVGKLNKKKTPTEKDNNLSAGESEGSKDTAVAKVNLVDEEERFFGAVGWKEYGQYAVAVGGSPVVLVLLALLTARQCFTVGATVWLGVWSGNVIQSFSQIDYIVSE